MKMLWLSALLLLAAGSACSGSGGDPAPCMGDEDCRMGERCVPDGTCVFGAECVNDMECTDPRTECSEEFACTFREGFGDECGAGRPCPFGSFCSELLGLCQDAASARDCTRRSQCGGRCAASATTANDQDVRGAPPTRGVVANARQRDVTGVAVVSRRGAH